MDQYFQKRCREENINLEVDLSNYATRANLQKAVGVDKYKLAAKFDLASIKPYFIKTDIEKW